MTGLLPFLNTARVLAARAVAIPNTGNTTENTLVTVTVPAGLMGSNGALEVVAYWSFTNNANAKTVRHKFGGTTLFGSSYPSVATVPWIHNLVNRDSASSQIFWQGNQIAASASAAAVFTVNSAIDRDVTLTAQCTNSADTITLEAYRIRLIQPPS